MANARSGGRFLVDERAAPGCDRIFTVPDKSFLDALVDVAGIALVVGPQAGTRA